MSEIGGFTQVLLTIGYIICSRISQLQLSKTIINDVFNFRTVINERQGSKSEQKLSNKDQLNQFTFIEQNIPTQKIDQSNTDKENICAKQTFVSFQNSSFLNQQPNLTCKQNQNQILQSIQNSIEKINLKNLRQNSTCENNDEKNQVDKQDLNQTDYKLLNNFQENNLFVNKKQQSENIESHSNGQKIPLNINQQSNQPQNQINPKTNIKKQFTERNRINSQSQSNQNQIILSSIIQNKKITSQETQADNVNQISEGYGKKSDSPVQNLSDNKFKKFLQSTTNSMKLSVLEYIKYFFWPFGEVKKKKQIIDYSIEKLYYHLDVLNVIKKLLEVDKLKKLIMDNDQIQVFEYMSKPTIKDEDVLNKNNCQEYNECDIQYQEKRSEVQKLQDAFKSYQNIKSRDQKSQMDKKLINLLDPNLIDLFDYNFNNKQKENSQNTEINNQNINIQQLQISIKQVQDALENTQCLKNNFSPIIQSKFFSIYPQNDQNMQLEEKSDLKTKDEEQDNNSIISDTNIPIEGIRQQQQKDATTHFRIVKQQQQLDKID